jgi:translation elongation factor EF-4
LPNPSKQVQSNLTCKRKLLVKQRQEEGRRFGEVYIPQEAFIAALTAEPTPYSCNTPLISLL